MLVRLWNYYRHRWNHVTLHGRPNYSLLCTVDLATTPKRMKSFIAMMNDTHHKGRKPWGGILLKAANKPGQPFTPFSNILLPMKMFFAAGTAVVGPPSPLSPDTAMSHKIPLPTLLQRNHVRGSSAAVLKQKCLLTLPEVCVTRGWYPPPHLVRFDCHHRRSKRNNQY